jgi:tetratricopeptide (TPR) repeat protein
MKQNILITAFTGLMILSGTALFISSCKSKASNITESKSNSTESLAIPALFERKGELAKSEEWGKTKAKVAELNQKIATKPNDIKSRLQIATIYMAEARITGEHPYYYPASLQILDGVLMMEPKNFEANVFKASVKMSQHKFAEAKELATKAMNINPDNAYVYGVLVDANVELGYYDEAVKMSDKMQALKPSLESYSRASYLREIYGDYPGAIDAMQMAVKAGLPGSEPYCWSKKTLAHLYEKTGKINEAENEYNEVLAVRPSYAFALEGLARIEKGRKNYPKALDLLQQASAIMPEFSFEEERAEIFEQTGDSKKAMEKYKETIKMLEQDEQSGHSVALEMCKLYTRMGLYDSAWIYGMKEYKMRPLNIDVNQVLAWISYKKNMKEKSLEYLKTALKTGSKDPELLQKAALIQKASI